MLRFQIILQGKAEKKVKKGKKSKKAWPAQDPVGGDKIAARRGAWGGRPPGGHRRRRGAEGPGWGGGDGLGSGHPQKSMQSPDGLYKHPTDYTKTRQTIQNPQKNCTKPQNVYKDLEYQTNTQKINKSSNSY